MEASNDPGGPERSTAPTVSREKWLNHARTKMARGYVLIIGSERRVANFYQPGKGYEMCAYNVAKRLVKEGIVAPTRTHHLGTVYELQVPLEIKRDVQTKPPKPEPEPESDVDVLLESLEQEVPDDGPDDDLED